MTQEDKRIAIFESLGWTLELLWTGELHGKPAGEQGPLRELPDVFNNLNACHDIEMNLPVWFSTSEESSYTGSRQNFRDLLSMISTQPIHATAAQRAEALYQTLCNKK